MIDILLKPVSVTERINSLDVLRGVALLGILLMNIVAYSLPWQAYDDPTVAGGAAGLNLKAWITASLFFEGTMRAIFSMLFGAGVVLFMLNGEKKSSGILPAELYFRRTLWLIFFGVIHAYLILWPGEILYRYGLAGLFLFSFRNLSPKVLVAISISLIMVGALIDHNHYKRTVELKEKALLAYQAKESGKELTFLEQSSIQGWEARIKESKPGAEEVKAWNDGMLSSNYFDIVKHLAPTNSMVQSIFTYKYIMWDVISFMLLGMAMFKAGLFSATASLRSYIFMVIAGYGLGITINYLEISIIRNSNFDILGFAEAGRTYQFGRLFNVFGHIGLIMIFCKLNILNFLKSALAAVGRMAFTNYVMHSIICAVVFYGIGFGLYGKLQRHELYYVVFSIWAFQLIVSPIWLNYFKMGPLEWVWRCLTYMKLQDFRKSTEKEEILLEKVNV
jgi:uncharacterized protein